MYLAQADVRYFETAWRKTPGYQGGFVLDGLSSVVWEDVHYIDYFKGGAHTAAAIRTLLPSALHKISAKTSLKKDYLAPVDTVNAEITLQDGLKGSLELAFSHPAPQTKPYFTATGSNGSVTIKAKPVDGARAYEVTFTPREGAAESQIYKTDGGESHCRVGRINSLPRLTKCPRKSASSLKLCPVRRPM